MSPRIATLTLCRVVGVALVFLTEIGFATASEPPTEAVNEFQTKVRSFLRTNCFKCHGDKKQSGNVRLDDLTADAGKDAERWASVREQLRDGLMPRRMLGPNELARAISLALTDRRDSGLVQAAQKGELSTKEQVAAHVRRLLHAAGRPRDRFGVADPGLRDIDASGPLAELLA